MRHALPYVMLAVVLFALFAAGAQAAPTDTPPPPDRPAAPTATDGEAAPELLLWEEIPTVVSASRREEPISRAPNAVSLVTADQIHRSGLLTLGELLRLAPGVDVGRISNWRHAIGVRGLHGLFTNHTLVLMDGRTVYDPIFGGGRWDGLPVLVEDIERIEVVRGPGGAVWGANAANGVINIITKKPGATPGLFLSQTVSSRLDSITHLRYGHVGENLDLRLSAGYEHLPEIGVRHGEGNHDFVRLARTHLRTTYRFDDERRLDVDAGYVDGQLGSEPGTSDDRWFPQTEFVQLRYTWEAAPDDAWYLQYFLNRITLDRSDGGNWTRATQHDVEAVRTQPAGDRHTLTYGGNLRVDKLTSGDPFGPNDVGIRFDNERTHNHQAGLFFQDRWAPAETWAFTLGARADRNSYTGWEWAGRAAALYMPAPEHTVRLAVARAFRTPSLGHRTTNIRTGPVPFPPGTFAFRLLGSEDLNASYIKAYEFGYTYEAKAVRLGAEFFWNNYRGLAQTVAQTPPGAFPVVHQHENSGDGDLYGFELTGRWQATKRLALDAAYVWEQWVQHGTRTYTEPALVETSLMAPPQQRVTLGSSYALLDGLTLNGWMTWVDEVHGQNAVRIAPYSRFDFNAVADLGHEAALTVGVQNAFDSRHAEAVGSGLPLMEVGERTWYVRFQKHW